EGIDATCGSAVDGTEVYHEDLIFLVLDQGVKHGDHRDPLAIGKIAAEDGILDVVAAAAQRLEDAVATIVVADVIGDDVSVAHAHLVANGGYSSISPVRNRASKRI